MTRDFFCLPPAKLCAKTQASLLYERGIPPPHATHRGQNGAQTLPLHDAQALRRSPRRPRRKRTRPSYHPLDGAADQRTHRTRCRSLHRQRRWKYLPRRRRIRQRYGPSIRRLHGHARNRHQRARTPRRPRENRPQNTRPLRHRHARDRRAVHPPTRQTTPRKRPHACAPWKSTPKSSAKPPKSTAFIAQTPSITRTPSSTPNSPTTKSSPKTSKSWTPPPSRSAEKTTSPSSSSI